MGYHGDCSGGDISLPLNASWFVQYLPHGSVGKWDLASPSVEIFSSHRTDPSSAQWQPRSTATIPLSWVKGYLCVPFSEPMQGFTGRVSAWSWSLHPACTDPGDSGQAVLGDELLWSSAHSWT